MLFGDLMEALKEEKLTFGIVESLQIFFKKLVFWPAYKNQKSDDKYPPCISQKVERP